MAIYNQNTNMNPNLNTYMVNPNQQQQPPYYIQQDYYNKTAVNPTFGNYYGQQQADFQKCRPVSSLQQAMMTQIDLDGSLWVFTDIGNGKIYTKQINKDGNSEFKVYKQAPQQLVKNSEEFVTKTEFNNVIQSLLAAIQPNGTTDSVTAITQEANSMKF